MKLTDLNKHPYALWFVGRLFDKQAQPLHIIEIDKGGFKLDLRVNLQKVQMERLLVKPINENMIGYNAVADYAKRTMEITLDASEAKQGKPTRDSGKVAT